MHIPSGFPRIQILLTAGLATRAVFHSILPYLSTPAVFQNCAILVASSGLLELAGITSYVFLVLNSIRRMRQSVKERPARQAVKPYFAMMLAGWMIYAALNLILLITMAANGTVRVNQAWNDFAINLFCGLVLLGASSILRKILNFRPRA